MQNLSEINKPNARRPYWLLLAFVLFFAGQIAAVSHWHEEATNSAHSIDCALCVLSSTAGAAIISDVVKIASIVLGSIFFFHAARVFVSQRAYIYQSRAPPF